MNYKSILTLFLTVSCLNPLLAQDHKYELSGFGGLSRVYVDGNNFFDRHEPDMGFLGGIGIRYNFGTHWSTQLVGAFERKGSRENILFTDINGNYLSSSAYLKSHFDYLTIALVPRYAIGGRLKGHIGIGPYLGYLQKQLVEVSADEEDFFGVKKTDHTESFKRGDFGMRAELGTTYYLSEHIAISLVLQQNLGIANTSFYIQSQHLNSTNAVLALAYNFK